MNEKTVELQKKLMKRTFEFSKQLIYEVVKLSNSESNKILIKQVIRSGTSIGANFREACEAESSKDFVHKIRISKKESKETEYWLELIKDCNQSVSENIIKLLIESKEFTKIFSAIIKKFK